MKLLQLEYFATVCRLGSVTQAASVLSVSQPAISAAIREIEGEFGVLLFQRVGKRLEITDAGRKLYELATDLLSRADTVSEIMTDLAKHRNRLRLGITPMNAALILPRLFQTFRTQYPDVVFTVSEGGRHDLFAKLDDGELDMVICSKNDALDAGYRKLHVMDVEMVLCVHAEHPLAGREEVSVTELAGEPLAAFTLSYQHNQNIERIYSAAGLTPNIVFRTSQLSTMLEMVSTGLASCFLHMPVHDRHPNLRYLSLTPRYYAPVNLYWRKGDYLYSDMEKLIDCIKSLKLK